MRNNSNLLFLVVEYVVHLNCWENKRTIDEYLHLEPVQEKCIAPKKSFCILIDQPQRLRRGCLRGRRAPGEQGAGQPSGGIARSRVTTGSNAKSPQTTTCSLAEGHLVGLLGRSFRPSWFCAPLPRAQAPFPQLKARSSRGSPLQPGSGPGCDINYTEWWRCGFYRLMCSIMLIHPIISYYINTERYITPGAAH